MFTVRGLSVLQYAAGYTGWLYRTGDHIFDVTGDGYLDSAAGMFRAGDTLVIVTPGGTAMRYVRTGGSAPVVLGRML